MCLRRITKAAILCRRANLSDAVSRRSIPPIRQISEEFFGKTALGLICAAGNFPHEGSFFLGGVTRNHRRVRTKRTGHHGRRNRHPQNGIDGRARAGGQGFSGQQPETERERVGACDEQIRRINRHQRDCCDASASQHALNEFSRHNTLNLRPLA